MKEGDDLLLQRARIIKDIAAGQGFQQCGIAAAGKLSGQQAAFKDFLKQGKHGPMHYLEDHFQKRMDPRKLVPGTKTIVSLLYGYYPDMYFPPAAPYKISRYALGKDYHMVVKAKLYKLVAELMEVFGRFNYRVFTDSAPVLERAWAREAGLGWIGKNTMLINRKYGSYFFLAEVFLDLDVTADQPLEHDFCGSCERCINACPTGALTAYVLDASKCISCLTIENRADKIPQTFKGKYRQWIFGCDICQEVCPWNRFAEPHQEPDFIPHKRLFSLTAKQWKEMNEQDYRELFRKSAVKRVKFKGLKRNIRFLSD
ncbi:MAG: tRNA epoxyqueuosine(34) reductase QueG [Bacteroidales bacterium]